MTDLTKNPDLRLRDKPDDFFGDWKWREGLAELMVPIIGKLYRNGVNILMYGNSLVNQSPIEIMKSKTRKREIVQCRQLAMYFAKQLTKNSLDMIGKHCGNKDHATVLHACKTVNNLADTDKRFKGYISDIEKRLTIS